VLMFSLKKSVDIVILMVLRCTIKNIFIFKYLR